MSIVSTRDLGPAKATRDRLVAAAIRLLEEGGPEAVQTRRVGAEIGASTMAVYTHFGGMKNLVVAVAREGFSRLARVMENVPATDDPVADMFELALAYRQYALENSQLYRVMFGLSVAGGHRLAPFDVDELMGTGRYPEGREAFALVYRGVERIIAAGDGAGGEPLTESLQLWSGAHGHVLLEFGGYFGPPEQSVHTVLVPLAEKLFAAMGHPPEAVRDSIRTVLARRGYA